MTVLVMTLIAAGGIAAFFVGAWFVGRLLIDHYGTVQTGLEEKRAAAYAKIANGIRTQLRTSLALIPKRLGAEAREVIEHLLTEETEGQ